MARQIVVTHERRGYWSRQLRGRLADRPIRWRESRSEADLRAIVLEAPCPIVVADLAPRPMERLVGLAWAAAEVTDPLVLAFNPEDDADLRQALRQCGATAVWSGFAPPPRVAELIDRWLPLARRRALEAGRSLGTDRDDDPNDPIAMLDL